MANKMSSWGHIVTLHTSILYQLRNCIRQYKTSSNLLVKPSFVTWDIRKGGGTFGKMEKAKEDEYFYKKTKSDIEKLSFSPEEKIRMVQEKIKLKDGNVKHYEMILQELQKDLERLKKPK